MLSLCEQLEVVSRGANDSEVRVEWRAAEGSGIVSVEGQLRGPRCKRARTLPTTFTVPPGGSALVIDPCYWTPQLPFLYDVNLSVNFADGSIVEWETSLGVSRWETIGRSFYRERRRMVLRGTVIEDPTAAILPPAVEAEVALFVVDPEDPFLQQASELGVPLVVDLRDCTGDLGARLRSYSWQPAVALVLIDAEAADLSERPRGLKVGCVAPTAKKDFIALELAKGERPPEWVVATEQPVIVIQRGRPYAELTAVRGKCDHLQAELAPQFDLAGYFV